MTPYIKRKCLQESNLIIKNNYSPFGQSSALNIITNTNYSPNRQLNESFETLQIHNNENFNPDNELNNGNLINNSNLIRKPLSKLSKLKRGGIGFNKFKSAPIQVLDFHTQQENRPHNNALGDISNCCLNNLNEQSNEDLENLCFGDVSSSLSLSSNMTQVSVVSSKLPHSKSELFIKQSLEIDVNTGSTLIGDRSCSHILPFKRSIKHHDLFSITPDTLVELINGKYSNDIDNYLIVDSRYPYEYEGGHIEQAKNIFTKEKLIEELFKHNSNGQIEASYMPKTPGKRTIIIFHCEFSSERGPSLLRFLRNQDRTLNEHEYPKLFYPEIYLLEGGYKCFYENYKTFCQPQEYKPMLHAEHLKDLKHFRAKAKSWEVQRQHLSAVSSIKISSSSLAIQHLQRHTSRLKHTMSMQE